VFVNQIPLVKARERERERRRKKRKVGVIHLDESVCVCVCIPYSFYSDAHICDTNDVQLNTSDCIIVTLSAIFKKKKM
jgi:uncharacterized UPF0160 family protein